MLGWQRILSGLQEKDGNVSWTEMLYCFYPPPIREFLEIVVNMKFDEEPNYPKLKVRPIKIDGAHKALIFSVLIYLHFY